jgi:hypothetical protein
VLELFALGLHEIEFRASFSLGDDPDEGRDASVCASFLNPSLDSRRDASVIDGRESLFEVRHSRTYHRRFVCSRYLHDRPPYRRRSPSAAQMRRQ